MGQSMPMKIVALPDLHGQTANIDSLGDVLREADVVLLPGDLTNGKMFELTRVLETIQTYNDHILAIPGNMDSDSINNHITEKGINLHLEQRIVEGIGFIGLGGALPYYGRFVFSDDEFSKMLTDLESHIDTSLPQLFVCHQPPMNTLNDKLANGGHVGSKAVREFIETHQPLVCFTGHIHEATGIDTIGKTQIINPGRLWRSDTYAYAEVDNGDLTVLEIRQV